MKQPLLSQTVSQRITHHRTLKHNSLQEVISAPDNFKQTFIKSDIVMNIEKMNMPPRPYKCNVRLPVRSISGIETSVIPTIIAPIPIVANLALSAVNPELVKRLVE